MTSRIFVRIVHTGLFCGLLFSGAVRLGAASAEEKMPELSEKVSTGVSALQPIFEKKDWDAALNSLNALLAITGPKSFDRAFLLQLKVPILANKNDNTGAGRALEDALEIADAMNLWRFPKLLTISEDASLESLTRVYMGEAQTTGKSVEQQRSDYTKALGYINRLISHTKRPTIDQLTLSAQAQYYLATVDSGKVDTALMKKALEQMQNAMLTVVSPKEEHYMMILACYQQMGDMVKASEVFELMVKRFPNNKTLWSGLFNSYLAQPGQDLRAIITIERAQALGLMKSPKENYQLAALCFNAQQYSRAAELFKTGLASGEIEPLQDNWGLYANCFERMGQEENAIAVFKQAAAKFPKVGNFDLQIGNLYYNRENLTEALKYMKSAVTKQLAKDQLAQTYYFIAFMSLDMRNLEEAKAAASKAVQLDPRNRGFKDLLDAVNQTINERDAFKKSRA